MKTISVYKKVPVIGAAFTLLTLLIFYSISYGSGGSFQPMPEAEYAEFLNMAAAITKANYENISTWQGELSIQEDDYLYGGKWGHLLQLDPNDPVFHSKSIRRSISALEKFAVDVRNNKLYTERGMPNVKSKALDLDKDLTVGRYSPAISIVTSDEYLSYEPNHRYGYDRDTIINGKWAGSAAFRWPVEKVSKEQWACVRDPRRYFLADNKKTVWEELDKLRNFITNPPLDIPEGKAPQISITTEDMVDYTKTHIKARFFRNPACTSCENEFVNIIITLDSSAGHNMTRREVIDKTGKTLQTYDITYEKIDNIYVPKTVHYVIFSSAEQQKKFDSMITFTKSILNAPLPADTFNYSKLGLEEGGRLIDKVTGENFTYHAGNFVEIEKKSK